MIEHFIETMVMDARQFMNHIVHNTYFIRLFSKNCNISFKDQNTYNITSSSFVFIHRDFTLAKPKMLQMNFFFYVEIIFCLLHLRVIHYTHNINSIHHSFYTLLYEYYTINVYIIMCQPNTIVINFIRCGRAGNWRILMYFFFFFLFFFYTLISWSNISFVSQIKWFSMKLNWQSI